MGIPGASGEAFIQYFMQLFTAASSKNMVLVIKAMELRVTPFMNEMLLRDFTVEDVGFTLNQMSPLKAPRSDGFSIDFHQKNWVNVGVEVSNAVFRILNNGCMNNDINLTYNALIPKIANPNRVTEFQPISLCNVFNKLVAKTFANRLQFVLPNIISPNQNAFIPGQLITDNVLAAYETLHTMQSRMWGKVSYMVVKLNMSKAYDRVECDFLEVIIY